MDYYPIFINLLGKKCLVVGGGPVAARKVEMLAKAGADITIIAEEVKSIPHTGSVEKVLRKKFEDKDVQGFYLVIAATDDAKTNEAVSHAARDHSILVNVVDNIDSSDFIVPSIVDRTPLLIAISTSGIAPALSKKIRQKLEKEYGVNHSKLLEILSVYRDKISCFSVDKKEGVYDQIFSDNFLLGLDKLSVEEIESHIKRILDEK